MESTDVRIKVRSHPERAHYDKETFYQIVDNSVFGHLSVVRDGWPHMVPMMVVRLGDEVLIHCRTRTQLAADLRSGLPAALAITIVRGIVFAKSVRFHSMNYDSLVLHGIPQLVEDVGRKRDMFISLLNHVWPGRASVVRPADDGELASVDVFAFDFSRCAAKLRRGGPAVKLDRGEYDGSGAVWAGWADLTQCISAFHPTPYGDESPVEPPKAPELQESRSVTGVVWEGSPASL